MTDGQGHGRRSAEAVERGRKKVADLSAIAGNGTFDERVHNLARYYDKVQPWGPPSKPRPPKPRSPARPQRESAVSIRRAASPRRIAGRRKHPRVFGWWVRCESCRRYLARDGSCITCDTPSEVSS